MTTIATLTDNHVASMVRKCCSLMRDDKRFGVAQFCETLYHCVILLTETLAVAQC